MRRQKWRRFKIRFKSIFPHKMNNVYLDNAATTQLRKEVVEVMTKVLSEDFGNPSSSHAFGRQAKSMLELARKSVAKNLNVSAQEIIFCASATEAINWILRSCVLSGTKRIITSKIEHHAVLHTVEQLQKEFNIDVKYVKINFDGNLDKANLTELLSDQVPTLVALMHVNNEVGTVLDLEQISRICKQSNALFFSDTVQSVGKVKIDLQEITADFIVASAHKFHGPKGAGFVFIRKGSNVKPLFYGGDQEKGMRSGTESLHNIVGLAKALEFSLDNLAQETEYISSLREYAMAEFKNHFPGTKINGDQKNGFYNILNICLPISEDKSALLLFNLDMKGIAISRGSACQSGSVRSSHVLSEMLTDEDLRKPSIRVSFSHYNTKADVDYLVEALRSL